MPEPSIRLPLDDFIREVAREAARVVIEEHVKTCQIRPVTQRVRGLELRLARLVGFLAGAGLLMAGAGVLRLCFGIP